MFSPVFPTIATPEGWQQKIEGPRMWLVPETAKPGARIVIPPLQARARNSSPPMYFDRILDQEKSRFAKVEIKPPIAITSRQHYPGLLADLHGFDDKGQPRESRCYAMFASDALFGVIFLQCHPAYFDQIRPAFVSLATTLEIPELDAPPPASMEPWDEL